MKSSYCLCCILYIGINVAAPRPQQEPVVVVSRPSSSIINNTTVNNRVTNQYTTNNYTSQPITGTILSKKDFAPTLTITKPGIYTLSESISLSQTTSSYGIAIACDDVIVDLNNFTISSQTQSTILHAIYITPGKKNIRIRNGSIRNFSGNGVWIDGTTFQPCINIFIDTVFIAESAIGIYGTNIQNIQITASNINHNHNGILIDHIEDALIESCQTQLNAHTQACAGIDLEHTVNSKLLNNKVDGNKSDDACYGIVVNESRGIMVENNKVSFNNSSSTLAQTAGIALTNCQNCLITANTALGHNASSQAAGILLVGSTICNVTENTTQHNGIGIQDKKPISNNLFMTNTSFGDTTAFEVHYSEGALHVIKAYPSSLETLAEANKYANIQIIV